MRIYWELRKEKLGSKNSIFFSAICWQVGNLVVGGAVGYEQTLPHQQIAFINLNMDGCCCCCTPVICFFGLNNKHGGVLGVWKTYA